MFLACVLASSRVFSTTQGFANRDSSAGMDSNRNLALCTDSSLVPQGLPAFLKGRGRVISSLWTARCGGTKRGASKQSTQLLSFRNSNTLQ